MFHRSPLTATAKDEDEFGHMSPQAEELWLKLGATRQDLDIWTENLRKVSTTERYPVSRI